MEDSNDSYSESTDDDFLYLCPLHEQCTSLFDEENIYKHFEFCHADLVKHFRPKFSIDYPQRDITRIIRYDKKSFVLKIRVGCHEPYMCCRYWIWIIGTKSVAANYKLNIYFKTNNNSAQFKVQIPICSLSTVLFSDIHTSLKPIWITRQDLTVCPIIVEIIKN